ncbi:carbonic anhydrase [Muriicola jejuensis]|uniref:Carbonic anhydrase n=1 Tax=Muriicola jejuensis TaxID=504488 RepID=A0A6P0UAD6_9FLAO|nr:carbonic anhydrase family protein [Muriicola jejuensis]NER09997.1 carbonic anhydrase [Muriicola jejuensis]SMP03924.1 carbonic anhydrase [Muriicola jejuensis]
MKNRIIIFSTMFGLTFSGMAQPSTQDVITIPRSKVLVETVLTKEEQRALTPEEVLQMLRAGNERFVRSDLTARDHSIQIRESVEGQYPKAIVLSCVDSRVPVEDVFDKGIGDIFVARIAGNFINEDILGSMEFATKVAGAKMILVMGHESCGAVHAAIDGAELGNITNMLQKIKPAVDMSTQTEGPRTSANRLFVHEVIENNVRLALENILEQSPILREMHSRGEIDILGAVYDMDTGVVNFLP